jgi:hypothetical protein
VPHRAGRARHRTVRPDRNPPARPPVPLSHQRVLVPPARLLAPLNRRTDPWRPAARSDGASDRDWVGRIAPSHQRHRHRRSVPRPRSHPACGRVRPGRRRGTGVSPAHAPEEGSATRRGRPGSPPPAPPSRGPRASGQVHGGALSGLQSGKVRTSPRRQQRSSPAAIRSSQLFPSPRRRPHRLTGQPIATPTPPRARSLRRRRGACS